MLAFPREGLATSASPKDYAGHFCKITGVFGINIPRGIHQDDPIPYFGTPDRALSLADLFWLGSLYSSASLSNSECVSWQRSLIYSLWCSPPLGCLPGSPTTKSLAIRLLPHARNEPWSTYHWGWLPLFPPGGKWANFQIPSYWLVSSSLRCRCPYGIGLQDLYGEIPVNNEGEEAGAGRGNLWLAKQTWHLRSEKGRKDWIGSTSDYSRVLRNRGNPQFRVTCTSSPFLFGHFLWAPGITWLLCKCTGSSFSWDSHHRFVMNSEWHLDYI